MKISRRDLLIVTVAAVSVVFYARTTGGFPLDDAWIHQTYGRNLGLTGHWEYVPGVPSAGSTSPFYTLLLALGYFLRIPPFAWTHGLGAAALALAGLTGARLADRLFPEVRGVGLFTGLALVTAWHLVWAAVSGMETTLFGALTLLILLLAGLEKTGSQKALFRSGALFGLVGAALIATRPEGVLPVGLVVGLRIVRTRWLALPWVGGALLGGLVGIAPYLLLNLSLNGTILPNTFSAKQAEHAPLLQQPFPVNLWAMVQPLTAGGQIALVPGMLWAVFVLIRRRDWLALAPALWGIGLILLYALRLPAYYQHGRYVIPALPALIVIGIGGTLLIVQAARRHWWSRVAVRSLAAAAFILFLVFWINGASYYVQDVKAINSDMVVTALWLAQNIPPDDLLAVHDIGAVGYFAPRPILDLAGLVSPEVIPIIRDPDALMALMRARGVRYLMMLPDQRPTPPDDPRLCERFNAHGGMGGMIVYAIVWDGHCP